MRLRDVRIFGGDADVTPRPWVVVRRLGGELRNRNPAAADPQVDGRVDLAEIELH